MILSVHHISKAFLEKQVLSDVTFHLEKGDRAAIVGINGAGKSTLLKIIIGEETPDEGTVAISREATWGYLAQTQNITTDHTIYEELLTVKKDVVEMEQKLAVDEKLMEKLTGKELEDLVTEYNDLLHRYQQENGYAYKGEITGVLRGLGFAEEEFSQKISTLSGGQKTRVALAKLLLEKPDILMLDEPTNHLDIGSIRWLETYLSNYRGTVLGELLLVCGEKEGPSRGAAPPVLKQPGADQAPGGGHRKASAVQPGEVHQAGGVPREDAE